MDKTKVKGNFDRPLRIFEAFAGIGAQRKALKNINKDFEVKGMAEWYVPAIISYQAIHNGLNVQKVNEISNLVSREEKIKFLSSKTLSNDSKNPVGANYWHRKNEDDLNLIFAAVKASSEEGNIFDVRTLHERQLSDVDLLTYSFPCQDLSQQGNQNGMSKGSNTRSGLLWEIEKALLKTFKNTPNDMPKFLLMENVKTLVNKKNMPDFEKWIKRLESLGYKNDYRVINSSDFGPPQARERVFMLSVYIKKVSGNFKLPAQRLENSDKKSIYSILDVNPRDKDLLLHLNNFRKTNPKMTKSNINKCSLLDYTSFNSENYLYLPDGTGPTLTASGANSRIKILDQGQIRKMSPLEAFRYMGFEDKDFKAVDEHKYLSDTKMIYICGNSISVEVLMAIFEELKKWKVTLL